MGRTPFTVRPADCDAGIVDRLAQECLPLDPGPSGTAALGSGGIEPVSPRAAQGSSAVDKIQASVQESEVAPQHLWFELSGPERQRFGHCFSLMVLKVLGLRASSFMEEQR
jgi:hypothetical protein